MAHNVGFGSVWLVVVLQVGGSTHNYHPVASAPQLLNAALTGICILTRKAYKNVSQSNC